MEPFVQEYLERLSARLDTYTNDITSLAENWAECSTQVGTIGNVDEVHGAATFVHIEPMTDPVHQAVEQLTPVQETFSIGGCTYSITKEVVPPMATTTNINPKVGIQELNEVPLFPINTSTLVTNELGGSCHILYFALLC
ncbi:lon peptidase n-terminal domain and ring finger protein 1 [Hordeum vulgare]|nr:lon peptidase n-terminal domain and ring finger protein 1 [Hordeum vulgare]